VHTDHLNRPIAMSNAAKSFVARYVWEPFGNSYSYTGTKGIDLRFPGQMFQAESGLHYNWFRQYDPTIGRYTQPDPLGLEAGVSRYAYVENNPMQRFDLKGLADFPFAGWGPLPWNYDPSVSQSEANPYIYSTDPNHNFPTSFDQEICTFGSVCKIDLADSKGPSGMYIQYCLDGALNKTEGRYEIGINYPWTWPFGTPNVVHRFFRPGATSNWFPW
jgi:RHS repeat-associated protein